MSPVWSHVHWRAIAGFASIGAATLLLVLGGVRADRVDLIWVAAACVALGGLAWFSRHHVKRSVP